MMERFVEETGDIREHMQSNGGSTTKSKIVHYEIEGMSDFLAEYNSNSDLCTERRMTEQV